MRHLKSFNESSFFITALGAAALLATVYNTVKRRAIVDRTKKRQFDKLGRLIDQWKNKDLKGKIIDNDDESQIV